MAGVAVAAFADMPGAGAPVEAAGGVAASLGSNWSKLRRARRQQSMQKVFGGLLAELNELSKAQVTNPIGSNGKRMRWDGQMFVEEDS